MGKKDLIPGIVWMVLGISISIYSKTLKLGKLASPGPGLMPFLLGLTLSIFSVLVVARSLLSAQKEKGLHEEGIWFQVDIKKIVLVTGSLIMYALLLEKIGFVITTLVILLILFRAVGSQKWSSVLVSSILTVLFTYLVFVIILKVELPYGFLGRVGW